MASNFECIGLGVPDGEGYEPLLMDLVDRSVPFATVGEITLRRWQDPSGARLTLVLRGNSVDYLLPSVAAAARVRLADLSPVNDDVMHARVDDEDGEQLTAMALEVEERHLHAADPRPWSGLAAVVALGQEVTVHPDEESFEASDDSLLDPSSKDDPPPPHYAEHGQQWPVRMAAGSFLSFGVFGPPEQSEAFARLNATVLRGERRRNAHTGQDFVVADVECAGFTVTLCLSATEHDVPRPGNVVSGVVFLVGSTGVTAPPATAPRLLRRLRRP